MRRLAMLALFLLPAAGAGAQAVVDPGMTKAQVVAKLGKPLVERSTGTSTFLFYRNGTERKVGMNDVVVLTDGKVVDAVFRSPARRYSGKSSSPSAIPAAVARQQGKAVRPAARQPEPAPVKGAKLRPAEQAQQSEIAKPIPPARSAIRDARQAAEAKAAETQAAQAKAAADSAKQAPTKKP